MEEENKENDEEEGSLIVRKPVMLFGKDLRTVACFRKSFLTGITLGISAGLLTFMFTSNLRLSNKVGVGSLWLGVFSYWIPCRINHERSTLMAEYMKTHKNWQFEQEQ